MAGSFKLENYETVKARKARFKNDYPDGRIVVYDISESPREYAFFRAFVYMNRDDQKEDLPVGSGHALELREWEKSLNRYGKEYEGVNYTSWTENCEESAVGRALDNAGYASSPSRNEMEKVQRASSSDSGEPLSEDQKPEMTEEHLEIAREDVRTLVREAHKEGIIDAKAEEGAIDTVNKQKTLSSINGCKKAYKDRFDELRKTKPSGGEEKSSGSSGAEPEQPEFY